MFFKVPVFVIGAPEARILGIEVVLVCMEGRIRDGGNRVFELRVG